MCGGFLCYMCRRAPRPRLFPVRTLVRSHGARKGLADTALQTADSGYLTRKLVDVSQDIVIRELDCETTNGIWRLAIYEGEDEVVQLKDRLVGRTAAEDIINPVNPDEYLCEAGQVIDEAHAGIIDDAGVERVRSEEHTSELQSQA